MRLDGKVVIVTGAGSGIGANIAIRMAREGATLVLNDLNETGLTQTAADIEGLGARVAFVRGDISDGRHYAALVAEADARYGRLDVVVNNAGWSYQNKPMTEVTEAEFDRVLTVNLKSIYMSVIHAVPIMIRSGGGSFINIASVAGIRASAGLSWYGASKAAVIAASSGIAVELGSKNLRSNCINPGFNPDTGLADAFMGGELDSARRASVLSKVPLNRLCSSSDIAAAAVFLASDEAAFITGTCITVDGGRAA
ncbi:MAG: SDR family oxidoreductase [Burkholderiaceae bacterium]|nr:SDR family oxidoreductase [Burkholderiaceae bacterium]